MAFQQNGEDLSRRRFIRQAGCLLIGFNLQPLIPGFGFAFDQDPDLPGSLRRYPGIDSWLEVLAGNRIRVFTGKIELGQGITTVIRQVAAEELHCELYQVEVVMADTGRTPNEGYTAGSGSVKASAMAVRHAAAAAREELCRLASEKTGHPVDDLILDNGLVKDRQGRVSVAVSELLEGKRWQKEVTLPVKLKPKDQYRYVGKPVPSADLPGIVSGSPFFITDLRFSGMLHARVLRPPAYAAKLLSLDRGAINKGLIQGLELVTNGHFVALAGPDEYQVIRGMELVSAHAKWTTPQNLPGQATLKENLVDMVTGHESVAEVDNSSDVRQSLKVFTGSYFKPYVMHASLQPACGIARYQEGKLEVWTHSQGVFPFRAALASMLTMKEEDIRVTGVPGAGCFGHNSSDDAAADAAIIAKALPGRYIRVQWSRQQENRWEALGCAMRMDIEAGLSSEGTISYWNAEVWTDSHSTRPNTDAGTLLSARYLEFPTNLQSRGYLGGGHRNADPYYSVANKRIVAHFYEGPLRVSSLRSLGAYANIFAIESIMDQMSEYLKMDPLDFRIKNLGDQRAIEVIKRLNDLTRLVRPAAREGLGYAFARYKNNDAYCAVAVHAGRDREGVISLLKMWAVVDAGEIMNPEGLTKQVEGAMLQAASWTLMEEVLFDQQHIVSDDWLSYPVYRFRDIPAVEVVLIDRPEEPALGGGEVAVIPVPAAITNAIYRITGQRIYDLPVRG
jgi:nicotinate dehydrogenase subunit B